MQEFKLLNFRRAHPGISPPSVRALTAEEVQQVRRVLALRLNSNASTADLPERLLHAESLVENADATGAHFALDQAFASAGIVPRGRVLINWYRFDEIDEFLWADLVLYFDDIWYPSSDDIDIMDPACEWVLSVTHYGAIMVAKFET